MAFIGFRGYFFKVIGVGVRDCICCSRHSGSLAFKFYLSARKSKTKLKLYVEFKSDSDDIGNSVSIILFN